MKDRTIYSFVSMSSPTRPRSECTIDEALAMATEDSFEAQARIDLHDALGKYVLSVCSLGSGVVYYFDLLNTER